MAATLVVVASSLCVLEHQGPCVPLTDYQLSYVNHGWFLPVAPSEEFRNPGGAIDYQLFDESDGWFPPGAPDAPNEKFGNFWRALARTPGHTPITDTILAQAWPARCMRGKQQTQPMLCCIIAAVLAGYRGRFHRRSNRSRGRGQTQVHSDGQDALASTSLPSNATMPWWSYERFVEASIVSSGIPWHFRIWLPTADVVADPQCLATILYLHGVGECGTDNWAQCGAGLASALSNKLGASFVALVVIPQLPERGDSPMWEAWSASAVQLALDAMLDYARNLYNNHTGNVYCIGESLGCHGVLTMACRRPALFAAIVVSGGSLEEFNWQTWKWAHVPAVSAYCKIVASIACPVWVAHGGRDYVVPHEHSVRLAIALEMSNASVILHIVPEEGHAVWDDMYEQGHVFEWLFKHGGSMESECAQPG